MELARIKDTDRVRLAPNRSVQESIGQVAEILDHKRANGEWAEQYLLKLKNGRMFWYPANDIVISSLEGEG